MKYKVKILSLNMEKVSHAEKIHTENHKHLDSLSSSVEYLKLTNPEKYKKFQAIGDSLMNCDYDDIVIGKDDEGDKIKAAILLQTYTDYGIDLDEKEKELLNKVYGESWKKIDFIDMKI